MEPKPLCRSDRRKVSLVRLPLNAPQSQTALLREIQRVLEKNATRICQDVRALKLRNDKDMPDLDAGVRDRAVHERDYATEGLSGDFALDIFCRASRFIFDSKEDETRVRINPGS